jgi:hypothetical protein
MDMLLIGKYPVNKILQSVPGDERPVGYTLG